MTATDYSFDAPAEIPAGLTTFHLVNKGPSIYHVQLVKFGEGKTLDDFKAAMKAPGPPPKWVTMEGGPNPPETNVHHHGGAQARQLRHALASFPGRTASRTWPRG